MSFCQLRQFHRDLIGTVDCGRALNNHTIGSDSAPVRLGNVIDVQIAVQITHTPPSCFIAIAISTTARGCGTPEKLRRLHRIGLGNGFRRQSRLRCKPAPVRLCNAIVGRPFQADVACRVSLSLGRLGQPGKADLQMSCKPAPVPQKRTGAAPYPTGLTRRILFRPRRLAGGAATRLPHCAGDF